MGNDKRPSGVYWVVIGASWVAAKYLSNAGLWLVPGSSAFFDESVLGYISKTPIPEPDISAFDAVRGKIVP